MPLCSRDSIPACVVCDQPTMEAGTDDRPWAESWSDGYVCGEACELRDILAHANPTENWHDMLDAAHRLGRDWGRLTVVRIHRSGCTPVEGAVIGHYTFPGFGAPHPAATWTLEDDNGDEVDVLGGMIARVEVVEDA